MSELEDIQLEDKLSKVEKDEQDKIHLERKQTYQNMMGTIQSYLFIPFSYGFSVALGLSFGYTVYDWLLLKIKK